MRRSSKCALRRREESDQMKVALDLQPCQSASRVRGVGRGSRALLFEMARCLLSHGHEVVFVLNESFHDSLTAVRDDVQRQVPGAYVVSFRVLSPCAPARPENAWRQFASRVLWERSLASLEPDFVHVPALLADGWGDDSIGSIGLIGVHVPTALTQHDLIPLAMADAYLPDGAFRDYYFGKLEMVKQADLLLAISDYSRKEAIDLIGFPAADVVNISSAADAFFCPGSVEDESGLTGIAGGRILPGFMLYAPGGFDYRKNVGRLLEAYAMLPGAMRGRHQLVLASHLDAGRREQIEGFARSLAISEHELVLTDYVSDVELRALYRRCHAYVFPSLHEGFGLPVLEAMACSAPVIASAFTSIPEVVGLDEALFDPLSVGAMSEKMAQVLSDASFRERLIRHAAFRPGHFSWRLSAERAVSAIESKSAMLAIEGWRPVRREQLPGVDALLDIANRAAQGVSGTSADQDAFKACFDHNCG